MEIHRSQEVLIPEAPNCLHENRDLSFWNLALQWLRKFVRILEVRVAVSGRRKICTDW